MTLAQWLVVIVAIIYAGISIAYGLQGAGKYGLAWVYAGYAFANVGLILTDRGW